MLIDLATVAPIPAALAASGFPAGVIVAAVAIVMVFLLSLLIWASRYVKVGPNEVLIIAGRRRRMRDSDGDIHTVGFRIVKGGGAFVWPVVEKFDILSLEVMTLEVKPPETYCITGAPVSVDGVAQIKVKSDDISIATAAEQFLSKGQRQIMEIALQTVEGHLRAIVGTMSIEDIYKNRDVFSQKVQEMASTDMANMGLHIVSFTLREIRDSKGYLDALGKPRIAQVKRDATIGEAEATRDATIKSAQANQAGQEAKYEAETHIALASRDYEMKVAEYQAAINQKKAEADLAYDLQKFKTGQLVKKEEVGVEVVEKQNRIQVQEQEILRKEKELKATVERPADAERYRVTTLAEGERARTQIEAEGKARAIEQVGRGEAEARRARGLAEAEVIQATGTAEAEAMHRKADAWARYNEAALTQMVLDRLPDIARAVAEPLSRIERMVVISGGDSGGASRITQDVTNVIAQLPPLVEALTGVDLANVIKHVPKILDPTPPAPGHSVPPRTPAAAAERPGKKER
ncbi:MAG: flotillin family protein [Planctomycetes bacterium]|nr:flotillin family protein [Planctomycetota bacterium]